MMCYWQVYMCMMGELIVMRSLILFERDKDINEVTYIYNNTNMFMHREKLMQRFMKAFYYFNLLCCFGFLCVLYYEGFDVLLDDRLDIDYEISTIKNGLYYFIVAMLVGIVGGQAFVQIHLLLLMCKLHYFEFKRVGVQMASMLISQIFFIIFAMLFINEWRIYRNKD